MNKLSIIILTHNEQHNIANCIQSANFADEILVIDHYFYTLQKYQRYYYSRQTSKE